jgi:Acyl-CoA reductase (LuxC)
MELEKRLLAFEKLGKRVKTLDKQTIEEWCLATANENPWFTPVSINFALQGICKFLQLDTLKKWVSKYSIPSPTTKKVAVIMAGNIPLVGFHDFMCVLLSGHSVVAKVSSKDSKLIGYLIDELLTIEPALTGSILIERNTLKTFDAVIATGSDNSARYFNYYFAKYPNIIRKNRTSCAIITGKETREELEILGHDVFTYYGLGCRNVSKLFVPYGYNFTPLLDSWKGFSETIHHHKYCNNYDYQKAILLVDQKEHLDNGFVLLCESEKLVSPISVLHYQFYKTEDDLVNYILNNRDKLQCIVGKSELCTVSFGQSQTPAIWDYADDVDTMKFLCELTE